MALVSIACLRPETFPYHSLHRLAAYWHDRGIAIAVGQGFDPGSDACILHIDRSLITPDMVPPAPTGAPVLNGRVLDITKRRLSELEVRSGDDWDGPVMIKTILNHYGKPEREDTTPSAALRNRRRMAEISWRSARMLPEMTYPVLGHPRYVRRWVWDDPHYLVERLVTEMENGLYVLRGWMFLGDEGFGWKLVSPHPDVRFRDAHSFSFTADVPQELHAIRHRHGFDYGKFDYILKDGRPLVYDYNKTPAIHVEGIQPWLARLSRGIDAFLP